MTLNLVEDTIDWFLPNAHEKVWWQQFLRGGRTFLDIGAHVGTWTLNIGHRFERVFCFEPDVRAADALRRNLERAGMKHVEVIQAAVGAKNGTVQLSLYTNPCTNTLLPADAFSHGGRPPELMVDWAKRQFAFEPLVDEWNTRLRRLVDSVVPAFSEAAQ